MKKVSFILIAVFAMGLLISCSSSGKEQVWKVENVFYTENSSFNNLLLSALMGEQVKPQFIQLKDKQLKFVYSGNEVFETTILNKKEENQQLILQTSAGDIFISQISSQKLIIAISNTIYEVAQKV